MYWLAALVVVFELFNIGLPESFYASYKPYCSTTKKTFYITRGACYDYNVMHGGMVELKSNGQSVYNCKILIRPQFEGAVAIAFLRGQLNKGEEVTLASSSAMPVVWDWRTAPNTCFALGNSADVYYTNPYGYDTLSLQIYIFQKNSCSSQICKRCDIGLCGAWLLHDYVYMDTSCYIEKSLERRMCEETLMRIRISIMEITGIAIACLVCVFAVVYFSISYARKRRRRAAERVQFSMEPISMPAAQSVENQHDNPEIYGPPSYETVTAKRI